MRSNYIKGSEPDPDNTSLVAALPPPPIVIGE